MITSAALLKRSNKIDYRGGTNGSVSFMATVNDVGQTTVGAVGAHSRWAKTRRKTNMTESENDNNDACVDGTERKLRQMVGLITAMLDSNPGPRYICGHYTGEVRLIGDTTPGIVIWGDTGLDPLEPRVMDMFTAKLLRSLARHELDSVGIEGTERVSGARADWRVIISEKDDQDSSVEPDTKQSKNE